MTKQKDLIGSIDDYEKVMLCAAIAHGLYLRGQFGLPDPETTQTRTYATPLYRTFDPLEKPLEEAEVLQRIIWRVETYAVGRDRAVKVWVRQTG